MLRYELIAIDFDGTIVTEKFPRIGEFLPHAKRVMARIKESGGKIAIWTCRSGEREVQVAEFLKENGVEFDTINQPFPEIIEIYEDTSRKVFADVYIDDRSLHCKGKGIDWLEIEELLFEKD